MNEPSEVPEGYSWYCIPQTVSVEEGMNQVQRRLSSTACWLLALLIQVSTHSQFYSLAVIPEQSVENGPGKRKSVPSSFLKEHSTEEFLHAQKQPSRISWFTHI